MKILKRQSGFTIIELMIATVVFSMVLLVVLSSFLQVGRLFYKGVSIARTNEVSRTIVEELSVELKVEGANAITALQGPVTVNTPSPGGGPAVAKQAYYFCISSIRYTYIVNHQVELVPVTAANADSNFGLRRDGVAALNCTNPFATGFSNPREMLSNNMRIAHRDDLRITNTGVNLYNIHLHLSYGDSDLYDQNGNGVSDVGDIGTQPGVLCVGSLGGTQFCATSTIDTSVNAYGT